MNSRAISTIPDLLDRSAAERGDSAALFSVGEAGSVPAYSFAALRTAALSFAARLRGLGVEPGDRVLLLAENRPEWAVAYFGIFYAGAVAVPVLVDFIAEHVATVAAHAEIKVACATARTAAKLALVDATVPRVLIDSADFPGAASAADPAVLGSGDLACILYTSGTSGKSKGVMLSHGNLVSNAVSMSALFPVGPSDRFLSLMPLAHTLEGTAGFLVPVLNGSQIHYLDKPPTPSALASALLAARPTVMVAVPLIIEKMYRSRIEAPLKAHPLYRFAPTRKLAVAAAGRKLMAAFGGELRFFGIGGAALAPDVEEFLIGARFPFAIGYGLTETSPLVSSAMPFRTVPRSAGTALENVRVRIAPLDGDAAGAAGPAGGEIQVKGPNVMLGYYRDPERTAEAFTEDGWFRTGDLGSLDAAGRLFIRGRSKAMILGPSGENIYPEEIESVLNATGHVEESLVYAAKDGVLVALVVLNDAAKAALAAAGAAAGAASGAAADRAELLLADLRARANSRLAAFSRIARVVLHDEPFEKTATRKIKRFLYPKETAPDLG